MKFKKVFGWYSDTMPETTEAVIVVSKCGIVKSLPYRMWNSKNNGYSSRKERVYPLLTNRGKQRKEISDNKYYHVCIRDKSYSVHRLVALAWIPNPENKPQVNHKNGIKNDNRVENLEWATNLENRIHAKDSNIPRKSIEKVTDNDVLKMKEIRLNGVKWEEIGKMFGVTHETARFRTLKIMSLKEKNESAGVIFNIRNRKNG